MVEELPSYAIFETQQFQKDLRFLARAGHVHILEKLRRVVYPHLKEQPHYGPHIKQLKGYEPDTWRYRIGAWRFFYEINEADHTVYLTAASHRGSAY